MSDDALLLQSLRQPLGVHARCLACGAPTTGGKPYCLGHVELGLSPALRLAIECDRQQRADTDPWAEPEPEAPAPVPVYDHPREDRRRRPRPAQAVLIRDQRATAGAAGLWAGGLAPLGYRAVRVAAADGGGWTLEEDTATAPTVRLAFERYLATGQTLTVAQELREAGLTGRNGRPWSSQTVGYLLRNPAYAGRIRRTTGARGRARRLGGWVPGRHPALVPVEDWERVQELLDRGLRRGGSNGAGVSRNRGPAALRVESECVRCGGVTPHAIYMLDHGGQSRRCLPCRRARDQARRA